MIGQSDALAPLAPPRRLDLLRVAPRLARDGRAYDRAELVLLHAVRGRRTIAEPREHERQVLRVETQLGAHATPDGLAQALAGSGVPAAAVGPHGRERRLAVRS